MNLLGSSQPEAVWESFISQQCCFLEAQMPRGAPPVPAGRWVLHGVLGGIGCPPPSAVTTSWAPPAPSGLPLLCGSFPKSPGSCWTCAHVFVSRNCVQTLHRANSSSPWAITGVQGLESKHFCRAGVWAGKLYQSNVPKGTSGDALGL